MRSASFCMQSIVGFQEVPAEFLSHLLMGIIRNSMGIACVMEDAQRFSADTKNSASWSSLGCRTLICSWSTFSTRGIIILFT